jgi:hypothetical protein
MMGLSARGRYVYVRRPPEGQDVGHRPDDARLAAGVTFVVENSDFALPVRDQAGGLEHAQGDGDPCPPRAKHHGQKFVAERNDVAIDTIPRHEKPTRQPLLNRMPSVARRSLGYLDSRVTCRWQNPPERQIDLLELRAETSQFAARKGSEKAILDGL